MKLIDINKNKPEDKTPTVGEHLKASTEALLEKKHVDRPCVNSILIVIPGDGGLPIVTFSASIGFEEVGVMEMVKGVFLGIVGEDVEEYELDE